MLQGEFEYREWGGPRKGAGRKPKGERALVSHGVRERLARRFPVHVTTRLRAGLPKLRQRGEYRVLRAAFAKGCARFGFRLVHYSVQNNHLHMLVEAKDRAALSKGMQGLLIRVAKALNKLWARKGGVFADHYHDHILRTPREVRNALCYVLHNAKKHGLRIAEGLDFYSSGWWFDGWREQPEITGTDRLETPVAAPRTWLLGTGWRRSRLLSLFEAPLPHLA